MMLRVKSVFTWNVKNQGNVTMCGGGRSSAKAIPGVVRSFDFSDKNFKVAIVSILD